MKLDRFHEAYNDVDPRDRHNALWRLSPDVYCELNLMYPTDQFPLAELVLVGEERAPGAPLPGRLFGVEVFVDRTLPDGSVHLDVDDTITRAIKRAERQGLKHVTIVQAPKFEMPPFPPPPEVTVKALARKWWRSMRRWGR